MKRCHTKREFEELRDPAFDQTDKKYKCKLCYTRFDKFSVLHSHLISSHEEDKQLSKQDITVEDLKHPCDECELKFVTESVLKYHKGRLHTKKEKFVKCKICSKVVKRYSFKGHRLIHSTERDVECSLCYAKLKGPANLRNHEKSVHKSRLEILYLKGHKREFTHSCTECPLKFLTRDLQHKHQKKILWTNSAG